MAPVLLAGTAHVAVLPIHAARGATVTPRPDAWHLATGTAVACLLGSMASAALGEFTVARALVIPCLVATGYALARVRL